MLHRLRKAFLGPLLLTAGLSLTAQLHGETPQEAFTRLGESLQQAGVRNASAPDLVRLHELSVEAGTPFQSNNLISRYLTGGGAPTPELLLAGARSAFLTGDYPLATSRYKSFLAEGVGKGSQAAEAALELYRLLLEVVEDPEDAYQFIVKNGDRLRGHPSLLKYDLWALEKAMQDEAYPDAGRILARVLKEAIPLEQERTYFWTHLEELLRQASRGAAAHFAGRQYYQQIGERIRSERQQALWSLVSHNLRLLSAEEMGDSEKARKAHLERALKAARQAFEADPSADNLIQITEFLMGGDGRHNRSVWEIFADSREAFFATAFGELSSEEKTHFLRWQKDHQNFADIVAPAQQWSKWLLGDSSAFTAAGKDALANIPFSPGDLNKKHLRQKAKILAAVPSIPAAAIRALSEDSDLRAAAGILGGRESQYLPFAETSVYLKEVLWPAYEKAAGEKDEAYYHEVVLAYGASAFGLGPAGLYDEEGVADYLKSAWALGDTYDRSQFHEALRSIRWISFIGSRQDREVFERSRIEHSVRRWGSDLRKKVKEDDDPRARKALEQFTDIEDLLREIRENDPSQNWRHAPSDYLKLVARSWVAVEEKDQDTFDKDFRRLIPLLKKYGDGGHPFERAVFLEMVEAFKNKTMLKAQVELLEDMLEAYRGDRDDAITPGLSALFSAMAEAGNWRESWSRIPNDDKAISLRINDLLAQTLIREIEEDRFHPDIFEKFLASRNGRGWSEKETNLEVIEAMIDSRILFKVNYPEEANEGITAYYMNLIRNQFDSLEEKYPFANWFDQWYAQEIRETGWIDYTYRHRDGEDPNGIVAEAIVETLLNWETLPLGFDGEADPYTLEWVESRHEWALRAGGRRDLMRLADFLSKQAGKTRFDPDAIGQFWFELLPVRPNTNPGRDAIFERLQSYVDLAAASPERLGPPALDWLEDSREATLQFSGLRDKDYRLLQKMLSEMHVANWRRVSGREYLIPILLKHLDEQNSRAELIQSIPHFWLIQRADRESSVEEMLVNLTEKALEEGDYELAASLSVHGLEIADNALGSDARNRLTAVRSQALVRIGGIIPVEASDPRYPLYQAQLDYLSGSEENAWRSYQEHRERLLPMLQELNPQFLIWLISEHTRREQFTVAENLVQEMLPWMDEVKDSISPEIRGGLLLAQAFISFSDREFPSARAQYERIVNAEDFDQTRAQEDARLMVAEVDRITRQFDQAIDQLQRMSRRGSAYQRKQSHYQLARVYFDQEEYTQADRELAKVFSYQSNHSNALLLQGEINIHARRLQEATDIAIGIEAAQEIVVPGRPLSIHLEDANLAVVGAEESLEIRIWTSSGDEEIVNLFPKGNNRTRFEVQIPTELGEINQGDEVLQIFGSDEIRYDFSDGFRARRNLPESNPPLLRVASDAELNISSGEIISGDEQARRRLERMIRERQGDQDDARGNIARSEIRRADQIKPGNPIHLRVADPDRSVTAQRDTLSVDATTTSGDRVDAFPLQETEPHSGVFTGSIPTASAPATAFASNSDGARQPNSVISAGEHPSWIARRDNQRPKIFGVDLNDNVIPGSLTIEAPEPGRAIRAFRIDTSLNNQEFVTVGQWPDSIEDWNGQPRIHLARLDSDASIRSASDILNYLEIESLRYNRERVIAIPENFNGDFHKVAIEKRGAADLNRSSREYVARAELNLYMPRRQTRTLRLVTEKDREDTNFYLLVNGRAIPTGEGDFQFTESFSQGVHRIEVLVHSRREDQARFELQWNIEEPPYFTSIPDEQFDPVTFPQIQREAGIQAAAIEASEDGERFSIQFGDTSRARVVRMVIKDFEGDAPAISRWSMRDSEGNRTLPLDRDLTRLHEEDNLYIIPGDRISVSYTDPVTLSRDRQVHEAFLSATYHDATIQPAFSEYRDDGEESLFSMRRYQLGDAVNVVITDPDEDVSDQKDTVSFSARNALGDRISLTAIETEAHSGVFIGRMFPVSGEPERESEIKVREGDDLVLSYLDETNTDPGIPWSRTAIIEQAFYIEPELRLYSMEAFPDLPDGELPSSIPLDEGQREYFPEEQSLLAQRPVFPLEEPATGYLEAPLIAEILFPSITFSPRSQTVLYAQTERGREAYRETLRSSIRQSLRDSGDLTGEALEAAVNAKVEERMAEGFIPDVPGTIRLAQTPSGAGSFDAPDGFRQVIVRGDPDALSPIDDGRYTFTIPLELAPLPDHSPAMQETGEAAANLTEASQTLAVTGDDRIYLGFTFEDDLGDKRWLTAEADLVSAAFFHVMDRSYREILEMRHVGERLYFRVIDPARRQSDEAMVHLEVLVGNGREKQTFTFREELPYSGIFKTVATLVHANDTVDHPGENIVRLRYGEEVTFRYTAANGEVTERSIRTHKGADGEVVPFTKRFDEPERAVNTMFMMAEAHFELAKRQRELEQESLARRQIQQGRRLLDEAMRDFPESENQAQAEYLLANLALEFGEMAENEEIKERHFLEAVSRFTDIVAKHPDSTYAPQSQFKKALTFERMGELDRASEEYVRLSYRFPDNELVAETIARLGQYFLGVGREFKEQAEAETDPVEAEIILTRSKEMFRTAAEVFSRLSERFPSHKLAGRTNVLAGQCYLRASDYAEAVEVLQKIVDDSEQEPGVRAEAAYWSAEAYVRSSDNQNAFRMFKRLTWDFPETEWARYARGRLTESQFADMDE